MITAKKELNRQIVLLYLLTRNIVDQNISKVNTKLSHIHNLYCNLQRSIFRKWLPTSCCEILVFSQHNGED